ncbi:NADP-dependent oxidoreductase [Deinococcus aquiradiocola]|uniref:NADP-dependent oxidoreductase n=1 Tax=Deinococcus aquiradiocola TaxID=393059 RepID=A0A917PFF9_9DEIO|nr:NADP-dependent oxidoreductase [Deinococcus aquiradiocola]GGJ74629.1 NADP-dependent oxidoreductase [Deinococcus aquiradiocola]
MTTSDAHPTAQTSREVQLAARPVGTPKPSDFSMADVTLPPLEEGQVRVQNLYLTVDPYMRGRMNDVKSYTPPFALGETMTGGAVGRVLESRADGVQVGDVILHDRGWRTHANVNARQARVLTERPGVPLSAYLGVLGMPGLTAYAGLLRVAEFKAGDTVFVSGAAGAVGSAVGQIARLKGASRVIGSAGSADKVRHLTENLGFDAAFNYKDGPVAAQLKAAAPDGIDVYFDNVGGEHLEAAISSLKVGGHAAVCGMISQYNSTEANPAPRNLALMIGKQLTLRGFLVSPHYDLFDTFAEEVGGWIASGELKFDETVVDGIDATPEAFIGLLAGQNTGKMIVRL